ncbi:MAG: class I SAM-dependent rRNA methyltransferase [Bacteroidales bacterium]|nr:class I SAM-dependent rRNA methyltransferase [Bacteroidales bacterium]
MTTYPKVILKKGKEEALLRFHPWIFSGAIEKISGSYKEGDIAEVFAASGRYLATAYLLSGSIAAKVISFTQQEIDKAFWKSKLLEAYQLRERLGLVSSDKTNAYRLVHNEGDSMPGLIIDIYGGLAVIQAHSVGMYELRNVFAEILQEIYGEKLKAVFDKSSESLKKMTGFKVEDEFLFGSMPESEILENGNRFMVNAVSGQKTGFFLDQRDNRFLLAKYAKGRKVLNMFGYTGGFSVYAANAGATEVCTVDSSAPAIELCKANVKLNKIPAKNHKGVVADARQFLDQTEDGQYDLIILDPPAYAKNMDARKKALGGYRSINAAAFRKIKKGGLLFTFSCSQVVDRQMFTSAVTAAAVDAGRKVRVLHQLAQPADHPINLFHQEGEYLKGLVLSVE